MPFELVPGAAIGILGGGQLGRMLALAAAKLGLKTHVYAEEPESPAFDVASTRTVASYEDEPALAEFADEVELVTYEFENIPFRTAAIWLIPALFGQTPRHWRFARIDSPKKSFWRRRELRRLPTCGWTTQAHLPGRSPKSAGPRS